MAGEVELRGFLHLAERFRDGRVPRTIVLEQEVSGAELLARLGIDVKDVEVVFVNRKAYPLRNARITPGDRVALVPPGTPGPYRVLLGFKNE